MLNQRFKKLAAPFAAAFLLFSNLAQAGDNSASSAGVVMYDGFNNRSPDRDPGDRLNGTRSEFGSLTWTARPEVVFGQDLITNAAVGNTSHTGGVPFRPGDYPNEPLATVEATVDPRGSEWIGVGFSLSAEGGYWGHGQVWMILHRTGQVEVFANGTNERIHSQQAPNFNAYGFNSLALEYNSVQHNVTVWVNNTRILNERSITTPKSQINIQYVGFHMWSGNLNTIGQMKISHMAIRTRGLPPDTTPPTVYIDRPTEGEVVSGQFTCYGWATDASGVRSIYIYLVTPNGQFTRLNHVYGTLRADVCQVYQDPNCPNVGWTTPLDTRAFPDGKSYELRAYVYDTNNNYTIARRTFEIRNQPQLQPICYEDGFTNRWPDRLLGAPLHGTTMEIGQLRWNANPWVVFGIGHVTNTNTAQGSHIGGVPFNPRQFPGRPVATVTADINVTGSEWIAVGFSLSAQGGYWSHGQVWVLVESGGLTKIWADGTRHLVAQRQVNRLTPDGHFSVELQYHSTLNTVSAVVNGVVIASDVDLNRFGFSHNIHYAGFHMYNGNMGTYGQMKVDNFRVCASAQAQALTLAESDQLESLENNELTASGAEEADFVPAEYSLHQNYPNPFNPSTTISYALPQAGQVTLKIYNLAGQEVRTLMDGHQPAGVRTMTWDGKNDHGQQVPSGVYLYRIVSGEFAATKRMVLMK